MRLDLGYQFDAFQRRWRRHRRKVAKQRQVDSKLDFMPKFTLTAASIEDICRPHSERRYLVASRPPEPEVAPPLPVYSPGASSAAAAAAPARDSSRESESEPTCIICFDDYSIGQTVRVLHCGHIFHDGCIIEWFARTQAKFHECPMCKVPCYPEEVAQKAEDEANRQSQGSARQHLVQVF
ncbi:hypothetical protein GGF46_002828 [Coemansia sp. RSA 552]|nr:hypothetical protein GGF46_002828 [Coemansia sp. RSA 552]